MELQSKTRLQLIFEEIELTEVVKSISSNSNKTVMGADKVKTHVLLSFISLIAGKFLLKNRNPEKLTLQLN